MDLEPAGQLAGGAGRERLAKKPRSPKGAVRDGGGNASPAHIPTQVTLPGSALAGRCHHPPPPSMLLLGCHLGPRNSVARHDIRLRAVNVASTESSLL